MKNEENKNRGAEANSYRNWHHAKNTNDLRGYIMNLFGSERVVVRFSDKFETKNNEKVKESKEKNKKMENEEDTPLNPAESFPPDKHEKGMGGEVKKDKPEIRYNLDEQA